MLLSFENWKLFPLYNGLMPCCFVLKSCGYMSLSFYSTTSAALTQFANTECCLLANLFQQLLKLCYARKGFFSVIAWKVWLWCCGPHMNFLRHEFPLKFCSPSKHWHKTFLGITLGAFQACEANALVLVYSESRYKKCMHLSSCPWMAAIPQVLADLFTLSKLLVFCIILSPW